MKINNDRNAFYEYIGSRLRHYRRQAGLKQKEVASLLSVSPAQYQKYESGSNKVPVDVVLTICEHFSVALEAVIPTLRTGSTLGGSMPRALEDIQLSSDKHPCTPPEAEEIIRMNSAFARVSSQKKRQLLIELAENI